MSKRRLLVAGLSAGLLLAVSAVLVWRAPGGREGHDGPPLAPDVAATPPPAMDGAPSAAPAAAAARPEPRSATPEGVEVSADGGLERALRWSAVDLDALRREIPDNLYWETGAPTEDPEVHEARTRERARWNEAWGQVQAGLASEEEIHAYFAHRQRLSTDYIEFASLLLDRHRDVLPEQDVGLLELALRMHHTRLQELPRRLSEALERKQKQDALREAWLRDEARFAAPGVDAP